MSNDLDFGRLYKGEEYQIDIQIPYVGETFDSFELKFFTDSATTFDVPSTQYTVSSSTVNVNVNEHDLDVLADGVLRYYIEYVVNGVTTILCTNTMHYLKTPDGYSGQTAQDIYYEGYEAGLNAAGGEYADGYNEGVSVQKSRLSSIVITENNTYTRADGYSAVTVNVPQTGSTFIAQTKNYNLTSNGTTTITPDAGYDGITGGTITVDVPQTGHTDAEITAAYNSGYTAGEADGEVTGAAAQKALLATTAFTANGTYTRQNGWNQVNVNVPRQRLQSKTSVIYTINNGMTRKYFLPDAGYDGMISFDCYLYSYLQSPLNKFNFTIYFDDTLEVYQCFNVLVLYGSEAYDEIVEFKIDGVDCLRNPAVSFQKNTSHTFYLFGPNITPLLECFVTYWHSGGFSIVWDSWTEYGRVTPALYFTGIPMTYTSTTLTLDTDFVNGQVHFENVTELLLNGDMAYYSKDSLNFPNCTEIRLPDESAARFPNVLNYRNGDKFNLPQNGTLYAPDDEYITSWVNSEEEGATRFLFLLPDGWNVVPINPI